MNTYPLVYFVLRASRLLLMAFFVFSCKTFQEKESGVQKYNQSQTYHLRLNPLSASSYHYDITNETIIKLEVDDKKVNNQNKTELGITYNISRDSAGNFVFRSIYDRLHINTKNNNSETDLDAVNGSFSLDPTERMLGLLKDAIITATLNSGGDVITITGLNELGDKVMAGFANMNEEDKKVAREQWGSNIANGLIKKNFDQLFKFFPDSVVHLGDEWRLTSREQGELNYNITGFYKLKDINSDIAIIESSGKIISSNKGGNSKELGLPIVDLKGEQSGEFELETKTGMVISCRIKAEMEGVITVMGKEVPVKVWISVKVKGERKNYVE